MKWALELDLGKQAHMHDSTLLAEVLLNRQSFFCKGNYNFYPFSYLDFVFKVVT